MKKWSVFTVIVSFMLVLAGADESSKEPGQDKDGVSAKKPKRESREHQNRSAQTDEEMRMQMKEDWKAVKDLAEKTRKETDPAKKKKMTDQLRAKLVKRAETMNREQEIEEQLKRLLSGVKGHVGTGLFHKGKKEK